MKSAMRIMKGHVSQSGRISLPIELRKAVGLGQGGDVVIELDGHDIRIRTVDEVVTQAQGLSQRLLADKPESSLDAFLSERRREAEQE